MADIAPGRNAVGDRARPIFAQCTGGAISAALQADALGPTTVISDLGVLNSDPATNELVLTAVHPGVCVEQVRNATGWELRVATNFEITPKPTANELTALRDLHARTAAAHGSGAGAE